MTIEENELRQQRQLHDAITQFGGEDVDENGPPVLVRWALVCDWMQPTGERIICRLRSESTPVWEARGLLHEALRDWPGDNE